MYKKLGFTNLTLRFRFIILVLLVLIPLVIFELIGINSRFVHFEEMQIEYNLHQAESVKVEFLSYLDNLWNAEYAMGTAIVSKSFADRDIDTYLKKQLEVHPAVSQINWVDPKGMIVHGTTDNSYGKTLNDREHIQKLMAGADECVSDLVISRVTGRRIIIVARAIKKGGRLAGIVTIGLDPGKIGRILGIKSGGNADYGLVDSNGTIVCHSRWPRQTAGDYRDRNGPVRTALREKKTVSKIYRSQHTGKPRLGAAIPVAGTGWVSFSSISAEDAFAFGRADLVREGLVFLLVLLGSVAAAVYLAGLITSKTQIEILSAAKDDFLTMSSHELKTPLTVLVANLQLFTFHHKNFGEEKRNEILATLIRQARKLDRLVNDLLDVSRIASGRLKLTPSLISLGSVVRSFVDEQREVIRTHNLILGSVEECTVMIDQGRLEQVMSNIITNAIKYSPVGSSVTVSLAVEVDMALITITDQGVRIKPDDLPRLFERYYRSSRVGEVAGLGVGLYISNEIVKLHGGRIDVFSKVGEGSAFKIRIPTQNGVCAGIKPARWD